MAKIFDLKANGEVFYTIPFLNDEYAISKRATIIHKESLEIIKPYVLAKELYVMILGKEYKLSKLVMDTFIGPMVGKIQYIDKDPLNCQNSNLYYELSIIKDNDDLIINGIRFKPAAHFIDQRFYLSSNGVLFDRFQNPHSMLRKHGFSTREYLKYVTPMGFDDNLHHRMKHRWVYETWVGEIPNGCEVDHKNGKHWDCNIMNLEVVTPFENIQRSYDLTHVKHRAWTKDQIEFICKSISEGYELTEIIQMLGTDIPRRKLSELVHNIITKGYHSDISEKYNLSCYIPRDIKESKRSMNYDQIKEISQLIAEGKSDCEIAKKMKVTNGSIYNIRHRRSYKDLYEKTIKEITL